jgi:hypothetical protein
MPRVVVRLILAAGFLAPQMASGAPGAAERPASLVTRNLIMHKGIPYVPATDLARALGGTGRYDAAARRLEIQPGANGVLAVNPGPLAAFAAAAGVGSAAPRVSGPGSTQAPFFLRLGGHDIRIANAEEILLGSREPAASLVLLARLLGGTPRFDPGRGAWVLPTGGPTFPMAFR